MRRSLCAAVLLLAAPVVCLAGNSFVKPTTTLAAQTVNNTSAANTFASQSNGNLGARNISKVDVHSLLYSGNTTKVYAHLMVWFGSSSHMDVGYSSTDPAQVKRQIDDMVSRGINGVIIDWYGPNNDKDTATQLVMAEAEKHPGFTFAIMIDQGAIQWDSCSGCTPQEALISDLQYIEQEYFSSPAYMTQQGKPVVTNFDIDASYPGIDWNVVNAALSTKPIYLFQNNDGFSHVLSGGSYSWVMPTKTDYGMSYLDSFYAKGNSFPSETTVGATYKGFNDTLASWTKNRIMKQQCGQTWLQTFSEINGIYNSGKQLPDLQLVTWNDYEEGTEIESGIDNCFTLTPSISGNTLQWKITGSESTLDHYRVYLSSDGQNLMPLTDTLAGNRSVNLCSWAIPSGSYKLMVQSVGKPSMANLMSGTLTYKPSCSGNSAPQLSFAAAPSALVIASGKSGTFTVSASAESGAFNDPIALSCSGLSGGLRCSFSPAAITPGSGTATSVLTISTVTLSGLHLPQGKWEPMFAAATLPFSMVGLVLAGNRRRKFWTQLLLVGLVSGVCLIASSCGGGVGLSTPQSTPGSNYSIVVNGSSSTTQVSTTVDVTVH